MWALPESKVCLTPFALNYDYVSFEVCLMAEICTNSSQSDCMESINKHCFFSAVTDFQLDSGLAIVMNKYGLEESGQNLALCKIRVNVLLEVQRLTTSNTLVSKVGTQRPVSCVFFYYLNTLSNQSCQNLHVLIKWWFLIWAL